MKRIDRWRALRTLLGSAALWVGLGCLNAQQPGPASDAPLKKLSLEELMQVKVETVFAASRHEQKITEAPSSVSVVTVDEIKKFGHRTLADILNGVRGFYVTYDRGYHAIGIRGVNRPGDYGGRILITVDGHRLNDPVFDSAASGMDFLLDVDLIERIEVIRGPGSSLYGNNAFFGVINIITRKGSDLHGTEISGSAGSFDTYTGRISYGNRFTNGVELMISGTVYDSLGDRRLRYPEFAAINNGVAENADGARAGSMFASVSWKGLSLDGGFVNSLKHWPTAPFSSPDQVVIFNDSRFFVMDERAFAELKFQHEFAHEWELLTRVYYDHYRLDAQYPYDYFDPLNPVIINSDTARSESVGGEAQVSKIFFEKHRVTVGVEERSDLQVDQKNFDLEPAATYLDSRQSAYFFSGYAQDEFQVLKNLILNGGIRYDHFSTFGDAVNPRAAIIYQPWEPSTFKFLYGQAYRAPNAFENYYVDASTKLNPELGPETIRSYELVYEQKAGSHWRGSVSLFLNDIKDLIGANQDPGDGLFFSDNLDSVQTKGGEFEVEGRWAGGWRGLASYTYSRTEDVATGERLSNSPEHLAKLSLSVPLWRDQVFASFELQGMSARHTVRAGEVSGFWLANTTLFTRELIKGLEISASIYNLFDQRYADPAASYFIQNAIQQDGRTFRVKLTYQF